MTPINNNNSYYTSDDIIRRADCATTPQELQNMANNGDIPSPDVDLVDVETNEICGQAFSREAGNEVIQVLTSRNNATSNSPIRTKETSVKWTGLTDRLKRQVYDYCKDRWHSFSRPTWSWDTIYREINRQTKANVFPGFIRSTLKHIAVDMGTTLARKKIKRVYKRTTPKTTTVNNVSVKKGTRPIVLSTTANVEMSVEGTTIRSLKITLPVNNG